VQVSNLSLQTNETNNFKAKFLVVVVDKRKIFVDRVANSNI